MTRAPAFRKILVATDFSHCAHQALVLATEVARAASGELTILHVDELPASTYCFPGALALAGADMLAAVATGTEADLLAEKTWAEHAGVPVTTMHSCGVAHLEIVRIAEAGGFDLIVVGTHGRTGVGRLMLNAHILAQLGK